MPALRTTRSSARTSPSNHPLSTPQPLKPRKGASDPSASLRKLTFVPQEKVAAIVAAIQSCDGGLSKNQLAQISNFHGITQRAIAALARDNALADGPSAAVTTRFPRPNRTSSSVTDGHSLPGPSERARSQNRLGGKKAAHLPQNRQCPRPSSISEALEQYERRSQGLGELVAENTGPVKQAKRGAMKTTIEEWYKQNGCSPDHVAVSNFLREQCITLQAYSGYVRRYGDIWRSEYSLEQTIREVEGEGRGRRGRIISRNAQKALEGRLVSSQASTLGPTRKTKPRHKVTKPYLGLPKEPKVLKKEKQSASSSMAESVEGIVLGKRTNGVARAKKVHTTSHIMAHATMLNASNQGNSMEEEQHQAQWKKKIEDMYYKEAVVVGLIANTLSAKEIRYWPELNF
ncbi:hypothetical protein PIIN_09503 [Serendipita indica DSM 11827]|uniref:Uncharacterized protein n=1 Tax=Serendipita indica (strain DSM 11827) TaxID=1109443 RepID=G4TW27_SERID|nr:hypothetical protein PIIN_09503 [Serendipita indica DSM 11827]